MNSTQKDSDQPGEDRLLPVSVCRYGVGDLVEAVRTIDEEPCEDHPGQHLCTRGDLLVVRRVGNVWDCSVSHPEITDRSFGVMADEIKPWSTPRDLDKT